LAVPAPDQKPEGEATDKLPDDAPKPGIDNENDKGQDRNAEPAGQEPRSDAAEPQPEIAHEDPAALKICLSDLQAVGAKFAKIDPVDEGNGCGIEAPIEVDEALPGLALGGAVMRCQTALSLAHWLKNTVQPALDAASPGRKIVGVVPGTTFACRLRNNASSGVISEHARGNAFDVAAFKLDNGETLDMKPRQDDHTMEGAFQKAISAGACLYFTTLLAPGSDASHETHVHVDIKDRKNGYRICEPL
jgi:hypothetical protein